MTATREGRRSLRLAGLTSGGLAAALAVAAAVASAGSPAWVVVLLALASPLAACACLGLLLVRTSRVLDRRHRQLLAAVVDHDRRSQDEHGLLMRAREAAPREPLPPSPVAHPAPDPTPPVPAHPPAASWKNHPLTDTLMATGVFDGGYYRAVAVARFARDRDAASHYLSIGLRKLESPSPFVEVSKLPEPVRAAMREGDAAPLLLHLRSPEAVSAPLSDWFDAREAALAPDAVASHPGGALGVFLQTVDEQTRLPAPPGAPTRGALALQARRTLLEHADGVASARRLAGSREQAHWDQEQEHGWLASLRAGADPARRDRTVSVVMPVKDRVVQVADAIRSVQQQSHAAWELLVVDDGSTDGTWELLQAVSREDSRVRVLRNEGDGVASARNAGLAAASGSFVAFLDSDNEWVPHFLDTMLAAMLADGLSAAYSAAEVTRDDGHISYRAFQGGLDHLRVLNHVDINVLMVTTDLARQVGGFDPQIRRWVDHDFALRVAAVSEPRLLPFVGCRYHHAESSTDRITVRESEHWQWPVLAKAWTAWDDDATAARVPGRVSVVIPTYTDSQMTVGAVASVLEEGSDLDVEVVVVDNGSSMQTGQAIVRAFAGHPRVRYLRLPRNLNFAIGCNVGALHSSGALLFFLNNDTVLRPGALAPLVARLSQPEVLGVQPLLLYPDDTIQTAGTVFVADDALPCHLLTGHPASDADGVQELAFRVVTAAALLMRAEEFVAARGFDPIFVNGLEDVDLCLRLSQGGRSFAVEPASWVTHLESKTPGRSRNIAENRRLFLDRWRGRLPAAQPGHHERLGFTVAHVGTDGVVPPGPKPLVVRSARSPGRRWGLRISSIPGHRGDLWGDTHFADSLAASLRRTGESVAVYRHGAHDGPASAFDDVSLALRGLTRVRPMPGKINVLWVISHPELVTAEEMVGFDLVFAASVPWARRMSVRTGRPVTPLLQATDTERFHADVVARAQPGPVFVGGVHPSRPRQVVLDAVAAGVPLTVYGPGWSGVVDERLLGGDYVANDELGAVYRGSPRVLADHWRDMAEAGFIQNRVFDAVASGSRVVSDPVDGIGEMFEGAVQVYRSLDELAYLCSDEGSVRFPEDDQLVAIARRTAAAHSFDSRARQLLDAVGELSR